MKSPLLSGVMLFTLTAAQAQTLTPLNSDSEPDRMDWSQLAAKFGPFPKMPAGIKAGAVSKTLTNEYWRLLGQGHESFGKKAGVPVAYQAAQSEGDQLGQLSIAETMITQGASVLLVSPQTDANLQPAVEQAKADNIPVVNVNDAVIPQAAYYVGNVQRDNGVRVAKWFIANRPAGGKVAVFGTDGISDAYASIRAGDLSGTVDSFPVLTGEVALEAALRIVAKQNLPRVVTRPQALITRDNVERYKAKGVDVRAVLEQDAKSLN